MTATTPAFDAFTRQWAVLLTTYRKDGTPVGTAVSVAVEGDRAFFRTWETAGKMKRIRNNPEAEIAPCTPQGKPTGPAVRARTRVLDGAEARHAARLITRKHPTLHRLVPLVHRLWRTRTMHIELTPVAAEQQW